MKSNQVKFIVEFVATFKEITDEETKECYESEDEKEVIESITHQKVLLKALIENREFLKQFTLREAAYPVGEEITLLDSFLETDGKPSAVSILESAIESLPEESRKFFNSVKEKDLLIPSLGLLLLRPDFELSNVSVE